MSGAGSGFAGSVEGSFFRAPKWVDASKAPGTTVQVLPTWVSWLWGVSRLRHLIYSPNLVWLSIAIAVYAAFPYDLEAARTTGVPWWAGYRLGINFGVTFSYYGFWELTLYQWRWSQRKFRPQCMPSARRLMHNAAWAASGVLIYTALEATVVRLWATGRLPYITDAELLAAPADALRFALWVALVPIWRGFHFYFSHRLLHLRPIYKYVHCMHHFNTDVEPFAGLAMHPVEHLYYFSCLAPSLYFRMHPFHLLWNGAHLLLSPAASHSGWEDHLQSDQFHYIHHARFECNYGSASLPLDRLFGTFRSYLEAQPLPEEAAPKQDLGLLKYSGGFWAYLLLTLGAALLAAALSTGAVGVGLPAAAAAWWAAALLSHGPIALAVLMLLASGDAWSMRWPFEKERWLGKFGLHMALGYLVSVVPVHHAMAGALAPGFGLSSQVL